jgi:hypothetical protein
MPAESNVQHVTSSPQLRTRTMPPQLSGTSEKPRRWVKRYRTEVCAGTASVLSTVTAFPLDSVKTRMQTYPYTGFLHCVRDTHHHEGLRGFFRGTSSFLASCPISLTPTCLPNVLTTHTRPLGVTAPLASVTLVRTISFSIYQRSKYIYSDWMGKNLGFSPLEHVNKNGAYPNLGTIACFGAAGATAGSGITFIACESDSGEPSAAV